MKFVKTVPDKSGWYWTYDMSSDDWSTPVPTYLLVQLQIVYRNNVKFALSAYTDEFLKWGDRIVLPEVELENDD